MSLVDEIRAIQEKTKKMADDPSYENSSKLTQAIRQLGGLPNPIPKTYLTENYKSPKNKCGQPMEAIWSQTEYFQ